MKKIVLIGLLICLTIPGYLNAQLQVEKGFEFQEIVKIAEMYKNAPNLSFTIDYNYADSLHPDSTLEHLAGSCKMSDSRYYTNLDSAEYIQGYQYNVAVFYRDSAIIVNDRQEYADLMKLPVLDSVFNGAYVDSMKIVAIDTASNTLYLYLSPSSPYSKYYLIYSPLNYRILGIGFYIKNAPIGEAIGTAKVSISFSNYSTNPIPQDTFWEDKFIYRQSGEVRLKPTYASYQLLDNTTIKPTLLK
jgi:hypothetical protein